MKNQMKKAAAGLMMAAAAVILAGCVNVDYVGQRFEPLEEYASVRVFKENADFSPEEYKVIGRAAFSAPGDYSSVEIWEKIMETAREYGADGVKVISAQRELTGSVYRQPDIGRPGNSASGNTSGVNADGSPIYVDSFGGEISGKYTRIDTYENKIRVLMLLKTDKFKEAMARREAAAKAGEGK